MDLKQGQKGDLLGRKQQGQTGVCFLSASWGLTGEARLGEEVAQARGQLTGLSTWLGATGIEDLGTGELSLGWRSNQSQQLDEG